MTFLKELELELAKYQENLGRGNNKEKKAVRLLIYSYCAIGIRPRLPNSTYCSDETPR